LKTLTLIVPSLAPSLAQASADAVSRWPSLARLAGRGSLAPRPADAKLGWLDGAVLDSLGLLQAADTYPRAAVIRTGVSGERATGFWLRAQPIHFAAGLDRLTTVVLQGSGRMTAQESASLGALLSEHLQSAGFELHHAGQDEWLLRSERPLQLRTVTPEYAAAHPRGEILPQGSDAAALRRLMTELQMLLHEHPLNAKREARGAPAINAVWIHGEGTLSDVAAVSLPEAFGEDVYLQGVYRLHGKAVKPLPANAAALLSQVHGPTVAVVAVPDLDVLEAQWLAALSRAMRAGALSKLNVFLDGWRVTADRASLFKLWRRDLPPTEWAAC
jgi:hypothetical protein